MRPSVAQIRALMVSAAICLVFDVSNDVLEATTDEVRGIATSTRLENTVAANDTYDRNRRKWGNFDHKRHTTEYKVPCWQCHGYREGGSTRTFFLRPKKCGQCHTATPTFQ
jgi:hypothetical protein